MKPVFRPGTLERSFIAAVNHAQWIDETDTAAIWLGRELFRHLDNGRRQGTLDGIGGPDPNLAETAGRILAILRDLGLTPMAKHRLGLWEGENDDAFAQVVRIAASAVGDPAE